MLPVVSDLIIRFSRFGAWCPEKSRWWLSDWRRSGPGRIRRSAVAEGVRQPHPWDLVARVLHRRQADPRARPPAEGGVSASDGSFFWGGLAVGSYSDLGHLRRVVVAGTGPCQPVARTELAGSVMDTSSTLASARRGPAARAPLDRTDAFEFTGDTSLGSRNRPEPGSMAPRAYCGSVPTRSNVNTKVQPSSEGRLTSPYLRRCLATESRSASVSRL